MKQRMAWLLLAGLLAAAPGLAQSYKDLKYPPLGEIRIPQVEEFTLSNGLKVFLLEDHELPLVSGSALVRTGNLFDPPDKIGLATVTGEVLRTGGTTAKTGDELDELLENMAASVESSIGETSGRVRFSCLKDNLDEVLAVFKEVMASPEFRQEKLDLALRQERSIIGRRNDSPAGIAQREFFEVIYGRDNPYGWRMEYEHLDNIRREDLQAFHRRYFFPANITLAVYGDFSTAEMKARLESVFRDWTVRQEPVPPFPKVSGKPAPGIWVADKRDVNQTTFRIGHLGGLLKDPDYPTLDVMADILGGGFSSRLFDKVRTELGYAYNIRASWSANYNHPGVFAISGSTKSESTAETVKVILAEVERLRSSPVTDQELATAKQRIVNSFVFNFSTPSQTLFRLQTDAYEGYPRDFIFEYQKAVEKVTKEDVQRVARQYLEPETFTILAVGNSEKFDRPIAAFDWKPQPLDLTIPMPGAAPAKADAASLNQGAEALAKIQAALGGASRLAAVTDLVQTARASMNTPQGAISVSQVIQWKAPGYLRQEQEFPFGKMILYFDGTSGWMVTPQGSGPLPDPVRGQVEQSLFRLNIPLFLSDRAQNRQVSYIGPGLIEISGPQGNVVRVGFDEQTGLPTKKMYKSMGRGGAPADVVETLSDWREVDGVKFPFKVVLEQNGERSGETVIEEVKINSGLSVETMSKQP